MVVDTSALVAILLGEPEAARLARAIGHASRRLVAAPTLVETAAVMLARKGGGGEIALDALLHRLGITTVAMSPDAARMARLGYARYGRGGGSPGVLNFGDCLAYGVAMAEREPLLFKGDDFAATDVTVAPW